MMHIPNGIHLDRFHSQNGGSRSSRSAWPTLQVPGLHDRTLSKRGGRRERQRLPKNVKNKSLRGKKYLLSSSTGCGLRRGSLSNYQTDRRILPGSNTDSNLCLFPEKHKNYWSKLGGEEYILKRTGEIVSFSSTYFSKQVSSNPSGCRQPGSHRLKGAVVWPFPI